VFSHTEPRQGIVDYDPLFLDFAGEWRRFSTQAGRLQGKGVVLKFAGYDHREEATALLGRDIAVPREQLPDLEPDEYYWTDLLGLRVVTRQGVELGTVERLFETGANDVVVVAGERERLIPFLEDEVITEIDLKGGVMRVDWDPDF
jgi:16S rRNA processing protein RimM